jgi:hypothetical protein
MATQLCQKCKQAHPGQLCDYDEKGECPETRNVLLNDESEPTNKGQETSQHKSNG